MMEETNKKMPKIRMFSDDILLTANTKKMTASGVLLNEGKGEMMTRQTVIASGPASGVEPGEEVELNPARFRRERIPARHDTGPDTERIILPIEFIDGKPYLLVSTRELKYVYEKEEAPSLSIVKDDEESVQ